MTAHLSIGGSEPAELVLPGAAITDDSSVIPDSAALLAQVWCGEAKPERARATVRAIIALAMLAVGRAADPIAADSLAQGCPASIGITVRLASEPVYALRRNHRPPCTGIRTDD